MEVQLSGSLAYLSCQIGMRVVGGMAAESI